MLSGMPEDQLSADQPADPDNPAAQADEAVADDIRSLAGETPVLIGGEGAGATLATRLGATALESDAVTAAAGMPGS